MPGGGAAGVVGGKGVYGVFGGFMTLPKHFKQVPCSLTVVDGVPDAPETDDALLYLPFRRG
jgi:hypothetical protein